MRFEITPLQTKGGIQDKKIYLLNEMQSTLLITYLKNTEAVRNFKIELVRQFYTMRKLILERQTQTWQETRRIGKLTRKAETDVIQQLTKYAKAQGSKNAHMLYIVYSKLANGCAGISGRDIANVKQLNRLDMIEDIILNVIRRDMAQEKHYKMIYQDCKFRLNQFLDVSFMKPEQLTA